jgi:hypothetical protein
MTERLDRIEAITESNARAITAYAEQQKEFANRFDSFIQRMDQQGLQVTLIRDLTDDQAGEITYTQERTDDNELRIDALRADAIADRQSFREALREESQRSDQRFEALQKESDQRFEAMQENIQRLLLEIRSTNGAVAGLNTRVNDLEAS